MVYDINSPCGEIVHIISKLMQWTVTNRYTSIHDLPQNKATWKRKRAYQYGTETTSGGNRASSGRTKATGDISNVSSATSVQWISSLSRFPTRISINALPELLRERTQTQKRRNPMEKTRKRKSWPLQTYYQTAAPCIALEGWLSGWKKYSYKDLETIP